MSGVCPPVGGCTGEEQQMVVLGVRDEQVAGGSRGGHLSLYHVPQQCRKEKLRYPAVNEGPRWPPHTGQFPTSPSFLHDADLPNHFAASAAATSSLLPSPSALLNPSFDAIPYECGVPAVHLLYGNTPFSGAHGRQEQGVTSLTLSSAISPSSQNDQHNPSLSSVISAHGLYGQLPHPSQTAPRMTLVPAGPFTGYATILQGSRFLRPAQQLLEEVCGGGGAVTATLHCSGDETASLDLADDGMSDCRDIADGPICDGEYRGTMSRLISMLDEVCGRYKQYCRQVQEVITSFDAVAGLNAAAPYTPVALRTLLRHFKYLKSAIIDQLRFANKTAGKEGITKGITGDKIMDNSFDPQRVNCLTIANQQPIWRPQRGLPERAVMVLRAWLFEHFLHPYPSDMDKQLLAQQTGLSRNQVSNWFINARVRLWKPMVEEIHSMEQQHNHKIPEHDRGCHNNDRPGFPSTPRVSLKISDQPHKRLRDEHSQLHDHNIKEAPSSFSLTQDTFVHHCANLPMGVATSTASGGVSLALGLHQNEGACLDEPLSMNSVVHRLEEGGSTVAYFMGGIDGASDRHFGRDFDGHLLRQFVA